MLKKITHHAYRENLHIARAYNDIRTYRLSARVSALQCQDEKDDWCRNKTGLVGACPSMQKILCIATMLLWCDMLLISISMHRFSNIGSFYTPLS